ncbi:MAG TPA: BamA/TamA family outer membrane protein [Puia sp.]|nr:BamA/TamA family outer membrane protein [Puia sp.]
MSTKILLIVIAVAAALHVSAQTDSVPPKKDSLSGFDRFNKKAEALFKIIPVPIFSYSEEAGTIVGLAKFNLLHLSKKDTVSKPSKLSEVVSVSTKGRINASVATELLFDKNRFVVISYVNYKRQPEYIFGIGNDVTRDSVEEVQYDRAQFVATGMVLIAKNLYAGISWDVSDYFSIKPDSNSFLIRKQVTGVEGGWCVGVGFAGAYDTRDNRYNPYKGSYIISKFLFYLPGLGSQYQFKKFDFDARKYFNPWLKHVIALQATTTYCDGNTPFFELALMGGDNKMRGYYEGAYRDNVLVDAQVEYRMPVWNIFGVVGWIGTGRVADKYSSLSLDGFHLSYGGGLRIKVDSKNNTNLRFDMGFGPHNIKGFYINFAEAF